MKIRNNGEGDDALLSAATTVPEAVVHIHDVRDGKMVMIDKVRVRAGETVELKPRGLHLMLFGLPEKTVEEGEIILRLFFEKAGEIRMPVRFVRPGGMRPTSTESSR